MGDRTSRVALILAFVLFLAPGAIAQVSTTGMPTLAPMLEKVLPGVVGIAVRGNEVPQNDPVLSDPLVRRIFGLPEEDQPSPLQEFEAAGCGVIADASRGYIITNNHVIEDADEITVTLNDGRSLSATKIGTDWASDLAVVQVEADELTALPLGDSDKLRVGDYVVAVGNPFGLSQTVTMGIVSALGRSDLGLDDYEDFIQTDAPINPGNSGGALVNLNGEVVGINSAFIGPSDSSAGIGFAVPINMARSVMDQLIAYGEVRRGLLGVAVQDLTPELAKALGVDREYGAVVSEAKTGSPAEAAGIEAGDTIIEVDGQPITDALNLRTRIDRTPVGSHVRITLIRKGQTRQVTATLAQAKAAKLEAPADAPLLATVVLGSIKPNSPVFGRTEGAVVLSEAANSPAGEAGLTTGDLIVSANQQPVASPEDVVAVAKQTEDQLLLQVMRDSGMLFIVIQ